MLRPLKLSLLQAAKFCGLFAAARDSGRRTRQLLILCYHGISIEDEHEWAPGLYMTPETFAARLRLLQSGGYCVLPLAEALRRLDDGTLPPRSVVITFDDGNFDFYARAWPLLKEHNFPATVYLTTYYSDNNLPVFPLVLDYLLWKGRGRVLTFRLSADRDVVLDARTLHERRRGRETLLRYAEAEGLSAMEKNALAKALASALDIDYAPIVDRRLMHIMSPDEIRELAAAGIDFQLHTHRHRSPLDRESYQAEVSQNRERITAVTGSLPRHFCYPSGVSLPQFESWLDEEGVLSATTSAAGMVTSRSPRLFLPRLLDHQEMTSLEFESWLTGFADILPRRTVRSHRRMPNELPALARVG